VYWKNAMFCVIGKGIDILGGGGASGREKAVLNTEGERERESLGKNTLEGKRKSHTFFKY
jgi:hypothetical protein